MKVIATADLHGDLPDIPECDLLIIAGDVCPVDNHDESYQALWLVAEFRPWLLSQPARQSVFIGGNHDFICEIDGFEVEPDKFGAVYLEDSGLELDGAKMWGTPWVPHLPNWAFHDDDARNKFDAIPDDTNIVVSHGPISGVFDEVNGRSVGSSVLASRIQRVAPTVFISGHIHEHGGQHQTFGSTTFINASRMNEKYEPVNDLIEFDFDFGDDGWQITWP